MERFDLVVVGAGMDGLIVAKTYLDVHQDASVCIYDKALSIGGVWAKERLYPGVRTNHVWSAYEFSDFPMLGYGLKTDAHIPGPIMHQYLNDFADNFRLTRRVRLQKCVTHAVYRGDAGWMLKIREEKDGSGTSNDVHASKLVVATGLSSQPSMPLLQGATDFARPLLHVKDYARRTAELVDIQTLIVLGGGKSAMDVVFYNAAQGRNVQWVIRKSGQGPKWSTPIRTTPWKIRTDKIVNCRLISFFSPCIWANDGYSLIRHFLQKTWLGNRFVRKFVSDMRKNMAIDVGYDKNPETFKLKPWTHMFWHGAQINTLNFGEDVMEYVRNGQVQVYIADVDHLTEGTIHLAGGDIVKWDALVCATGWRYHSDILFEGISKEELGLPSYDTCTSLDLVAKANSEIDSQLPLLKNPPEEVRYDETMLARNNIPKQPFRLFRFTVPPLLSDTRNIAFSGLISTVSTSAIMQAQALWIAAYFHNQIDGIRIPDSEERASELRERLQWETILHSEFCRRRSPLGNGMTHADISPDSVPFLDVLFIDLGILRWRKPSAWKEVFEGYEPQDYRGLVHEWLVSRSMGKGVGRKPVN